MKKILFICSQPFFEWRGSPIRVGFDLQALSENGYKVIFITLPYGREKNIENVDIIRCCKLPFVKKIPIGPSAAKLIYDFIHLCYGFKILISHKDISFIHGVEDSGIPALLLSFLFRKKMVFEKHSDPASYKQSEKKIKNIILSLYQFIESLIIKKADLVIGTGDELVKQAEAVKNGLNALTIPDIPSSLAESSEDRVMSARKSLNIDADTVLACYVGSFAVYQGIDLLFSSIPETVKENKKVVFLIIGGTASEIEQRKKFLAENNCLDNVIFKGFVNPDELPEYLRAADILLSPRIKGQNSPLKVLDYLKAGRVIVATDIEANTQILNSENALLVKPEASMFAEGIVKLSRDTDLRLNLAVKGSELIRGKYNFKYFSAMLDKGYRSIS